MKNSPSIDEQIVLLEEETHKILPFERITGNGNIYEGISFLVLGIYFSISEFLSKAPMAKWVIIVLIFVLAIRALLLGFKRRKTHSLYLKNKKREPTKPWLWDLPWNPKETRNDLTNKDRGLFIFGVVVLSLWFLVVIDWSGLNKLLIIFLASIATVLLLVYWYLSRKTNWSNNKSNDDRLSFDRFPFWTGDQFSGKLWGFPEDLQNFKLILRFVVEHTFEGEDAGYFQMYEDTQTLGRARSGSKGQLVVEWDLPEGSEYSTQIDKDPFQYWELEIVGESPNSNYHGRFLLPIYSRVPSTEEHIKHFHNRITSSYSSIYKEG